jgi:hypothetical protein
MREVTVTATQGAAELLTCAFDMVAKAVSRAARSAPRTLGRRWPTTLML